MRRLSPLTARILIVNLLPLLLLLGAVLYLDGYQDRLIANELEAMSKEAHLFAVALGEGAVVSDDDERDLLSPELANMMMWRLVDNAQSRMRLYDVRGAQVGDSSLFVGRAAIEREELPAPHARNFFSDAWNRLVIMLRQHSWSKAYPPYVETIRPSSEDYEIVEHALDGDKGGEVWAQKDGHILLGVAVPVQRYKSVLGAVLLTRHGQNIEGAIHAVRVDILGLFVIILMLTILLSLYLARTISKPLQQLSGAAQTLKTGQIGALKWQASIPVFDGRRDEISDLSNALKAMVQALGTRMHAIESFAADVAHELKNPLTSLHSAVETVVKMNDPARQQKLMTIIADDVQRLDRLITDISAASRLEAELGRAKAKPIDLNAMLSMIADLYAPLDADAEKNKPKLLCLLPDETITVLGAQTRLVQVFQNLIDNALSFSPAGSAVTVTLEKSGRMACIKVEDSGPGIPENKLEAIFERFYSERPAGEKFGTHSGLGLSIARQIVEAHQGTLVAENISDPHKKGAVSGARFIVMVPAG